MSDESGTQVLLYVYDLSNGFAAQMSMALLGKQVYGSDVPYSRSHVTSPFAVPSMGSVQCSSSMSIVEA